MATRQTYYQNNPASGTAVGGRWGTILDGIAQTVNNVGTTVVDVIGTVKDTKESIRTIGEERDDQQVRVGTSTGTGVSQNQVMLLILAALVVYLIAKRR